MYSAPGRRIKNSPSLLPALPSWAARRSAPTSLAKIQAMLSEQGYIADDAVSMAVLCRNRRNLEDFDALFQQYWKELEKAVDSKIAQQEQRKPQPGWQQEAFKSLKTWLNGNQEKEEEHTAYYKLSENLNHRDFACLALER